MGSVSRSRWVWFVAGGSAVAFGALSAWAAGGRYLPGEDALLTQIIRARLPVLTLPVQAISALGSMNVILPAWFVLLLYLAWRRNAVAILTLLPIPLGYPLYAGLKALIARPGPTTAQFPWIYDLSIGYHAEGLLRRQLDTLPPQGVAVPVVPQPVTAQAVTTVMASGYPAGHAFLAVLFYGTLAWLIGRTFGAGRARSAVAAATCVLGALAVLVGIARVYMAVHFPSDVLGAWLLALPLVIALPTFARWAAKTLVRLARRIREPGRA